MTIQQYFDKINHRFKSGISTEHSYRPDLQNLLETLCVNTDTTNEPTRIACGAPDYILTKKGNSNFPVGYIEAKDLLENLKLDTIEKTEQLVRYRSSLSNLILTNYMDFHFYINGERVSDISIARIEGKKLIPLLENWTVFENLMKEFSQFKGITIKSAQKLAEMMASKARVMQDVLQRAVESDDKTEANSSLRDQLAAFKNVLIHDIKSEEFADIYAQTIAYGMFAARLHDSSMDTFTRQEAAELIPKSNPFLKKLFGYIAGVEIDDRIIWIVDALAEVFRSTDVAAILKNFGKATRMEDPMIHFYETFLATYNPNLRKSRGVWYTPEPVVNFIVRAVDDILKAEFGLSKGLADNSKIKIKKKVIKKATEDRRSKIREVEIDQEVHRVQILDPATGTGTFLAEVIRQVYSNFQDQQGIWSKYVEDHLIPRLHGFELLMASYAMAHLKLDLLLKESGYIQSKKENRLRVYLTNSLEEAHPDTSSLWANFLSQEASEANSVKRETPVMVVIGNPPYSGISQNTGKWITDLIEEYKYVEDKHFGEKKHWLGDDYVKFIRYAEYFIEKNRGGIIGFITNHRYLDNVTFRGMRYHLLKSFDHLYVINLHGNTQNNEIIFENDENVFDIQQGVSILLAIKKEIINKKDLAKVSYVDILGDRSSKYNFLASSELYNIEFAQTRPESPYFFFTPKIFTDSSKYNKGFKVTELFLTNVTGILTARDPLAVSFESQELLSRIDDFSNPEYSDDQVRSKYFKKKKKGKYPPGDTRGWKLEKARKLVAKEDKNKFIQSYDYRPFDSRKIYYSKTIVDWGRENLMYNLQNINVAIVVCRQTSSKKWAHCFVCNKLVDDSFVSNKSKERGYMNPLFVYNKTNNQNSLHSDDSYRPNLNPKIISIITERTGGKFVIPNNPLSSGNAKEITPIDIFDYIYAMLYSPTYRNKYKEHLNIDFPRIPYPKDLETFRQLVMFGCQLRQLHLLNTTLLDTVITKYPINGDNIVDKTKYKNNKVYINDTQYFEGVLETAWSFNIGGYQPAQKWLKDRKGRTLSYEDILHYQKIIVALTETGRIMKEIDKIKIE